MSVQIEAKAKGQASSGGGSKTFDQMKQSMGSMIKTPMTRTEACQILNIEDANPDEPVNHIDVIERFEVLFEKNSAENQGSFYMRSKIYFAKEHLMQDWPSELNVTKFDNEGEEGADDEADAAEDKADSEKDGD